MAQPETTGHTVCYRHPRVETGVRCSDCGRPICTECMVFGPVGIRCPECAGRPTGAKKTVHRLRTAGERAPIGVVTTVLVSVNVVVYLAEIATGSGWNSLAGDVFTQGFLSGPRVADGDWWRLITAAFLHASPIHLLFNMLMLWWFGRSLEALLGPGRFIGLYFASALAGSAGALLLTPNAPTVGASGAVFGILGAGLVLERRRIYVFGGSALGIVVINVILSFALSNVSVGGHLGGLVGGIACLLLIERLGRSAPLLSRDGVVTIIALIGVGALGVVVAYARVRGYG